MNIGRPALVALARASWIPRRLAFLLALLCASCAPLSDFRFDPRPVSIAEPIDSSTRSRLLSTAQTPEACAAWLEQAGVSFRPVADRTESDVCQVTGAGNLRDGSGQADPRLSPAGPMMTCRLAAAVAVWRRQSVGPAAREMLGADVQQIDHLGVYACRNVNSQATGRPSAHARAEAIDIAGFRLSDGRRITVARDWNAQSAEARFLRRIRDDACRLPPVRHDLVARLQHPACRPPPPRRRPCRPMQLTRRVRRKPQIQVSPPAIP